MCRSRSAIFGRALEFSQSARLLAMILLASAVILGAHYRLYRLGRLNLSSDEGAAWAGASQPTIAAVIAIEPTVENGGKLAAYDVLLHEWIGLVGDKASSMRRLSALNGTVVIVLVFLVVREICRLLAEEPSAVSADLAGAFAALIYATNATMVQSDRTAREFPLLFTMELLQIFFFVRAQRFGKLTNYFGAGLFTALMIPVNFTSAFLLFAEALWLGCLLLARWSGARLADVAIFRPGLAVTSGVLVLVPLVPRMIADSQRAIETGALQWIKPQPLGWAFNTLHDSANSPVAFWIFVTLAVFAVWRNLRSAYLVSAFLAFWTIAPLVAIFAVSRLIQPMEYPRYVRIAFIGMFGFAGFGAASVRSVAARVMLAGALVWLSIPSLRALKYYPTASFREATALVASKTIRGQKIAVYTPYTVSVVRYYLSSDRRVDAIPLDAIPLNDDCAPARFLIFRGWAWATPALLAEVNRCYPRVVRRLRGVEVRTR